MNTGYELGYKPLLDKAIPSSEVDRIMAKLFCNTRPEMPQQKLTAMEVGIFKNHFEPAYERLQTGLYDLTSILFENLYPGEPKITLLRWGQIGYPTGQMTDASEPLRTEYTGRWEEIMSMSDEELTFSQPEIPHDKSQGMYLLVKKSALEYRPDPALKTIDHFTTRMKSEDSLARKIVRRFFKIDDQEEDRIGSEFGITDIGGVKIVASTQTDCYEVFDFLKSLQHPGITIVEGTLKDYIKNPKKNGYQAIHSNVEIAGQWLELQIRDCEMDRRAEEGEKINHAAYGERKTWLLREKNKETGGRVFATLAELNRVLQSREGYLII